MEIRERLRGWLGITARDTRIRELGDRLELAWQRIVALEQGQHEKRICTLEQRSDPKLELVEGRLAGLDIITTAHASELTELMAFKSELHAAFQEIRQLREMLQDPKRTPIMAKTSHQFRTLMEVE